MFHEHTELLIVAHKSAADFAAIFNTGTAQFAAGIGEVAYASCVALYVTLLGGLADSEHDLPPLVRLGCAVFVSLNIILNQYFRFVGIVPITPPARQRASPRGLTTMPFWLGLYWPSIIGRLYIKH